MEAGLEVEGFQAALRIHDPSLELFQHSRLPPRRQVAPVGGENLVTVRFHRGLPGILRPADSLPQGTVLHGLGGKPAPRAQERTQLL